MFHHHALLKGRSGARILVATTSILLLLLTAAFGVAAQDTSTLTVGTNAPVNLEPASGSNDPEILFNRMLYDYLIDLKSDSSLAPNLATEWTISDDGLTYTLTLAEGVTFHDGAAFSASDVVYTFERLKMLESPALSLLSGGAFTVTADSDTQVTFALEAPNADFLFGLAGRHTFILSEDTADVNVIGDGDSAFANFNGTGAFVLSEYSAGERAVFVKNDNYWKDGQPLLDRVEHVYFDDPIAQIDALRSGVVNFIFKVPVDQISTLESSAGVTVISTPTNQHPVIRIRTAEGFRGTDVRIRQALKLGVDRDELNEIMLNGQGAVGNNDPIGPAFGAFYDDSIEKPAYDPARACELIQEATGEERISFDFYVVDALGYPDLAAVMQQQWAEACIDVNLLVRPENVYYGDNEWLDVELGLTGWGDRPIAQQLLIEAYTSDALYNESNFNSAALDALVADASITTDLDARAGIYSQIAQIFAEEGPIIVPFFAPMVGAVTENVENLDMYGFPGLTDFREVSVR
jgi:peptide/nickel transport system substrate-binding protein